jgi:alpha-D-ribose 1-methylphosphonate 5-triphosphate synthase subunit PhnL
MSYLDPRLSRHLRNAHEDMLIDAIFILVEHNQDSPEIWGGEELVKHVLQEVVAQTDEQPSFFRIIPRANAIALTAHPKFLNALINHSCVQVASSATVDPFSFY